MQCKQIRTFLDVFLCANSELYRLNCAIFCHSLLLIMSAKDKKSRSFQLF